MTFPIIISALQTPLPPREAYSQVNAGRNNNGRAVEIIPSKRPVPGFFPRLRKWTVRPFRENRLEAPSAIPTESRQDAASVDNNANVDTWIDLEKPAELGGTLLADLDLGELPMATNDLSLACYLEAQRSLEAFIHEYATAFVASYKGARSAWYGLSSDQKRYLNSITSGPLGLLMPHVMSMTPPSANKSDTSQDPLEKYKFDISHFDLYRRDFRFEPGPRFTSMMQSLWTRIDIKKKCIYEKQREITRTAIARGLKPVKIRWTPGDGVSLPQTHGSPAARAVLSDLLQKQSCIEADYQTSDEWEEIACAEKPDHGLQAEDDMPPDEWAVIRNISNQSRPQPVSGPVKGKPALTACGLSKRRYLKVQQSLEKFIPKAAREFLVSWQHSHDTGLAWNRLTRNEWQYLHDIQSKPPLLSMPRVASMPPAQTPLEESEHYDIYRQDFGFEPSPRFLRIMQSLWKRINLEKRDLYHVQGAFSKAEEWRPFKVNLQEDTGFNDRKSCEPSPPVRRFTSVSSERK